MFDINLLDRVPDYPLLHMFLGLAALCLVAFIINWFAKQVMLRAIGRALAAGQPDMDKSLLQSAVRRLANILPALVIYQGVSAIPEIPEGVEAVTRNVAAAFIVLTLVLALSVALDMVNQVYQRRPDAQNRPIKGYLQVVKLVAYGAGTILIIATLIERSPLLLLSGLGAMAAVLMLVFKDTLLSLVASVQLTSNDMIRVGDWIEMPQLNADGDVIDVALHTVKVQNWDKTITTIPTYRLISESFKNWRGMRESGGRRIKRALLLDQTSVHFLAPEEIERLRHIALLKDYLDRKQEEISAWNARLGAVGKVPVNQRRVTNIGTFRAYVQAFLRAHAGINQDMTLLVRQLAPGPEGVPLEIYCFTRSVLWADYEAVQSDIFDHLLAILPEFNLRLYQQPSGADLARFMRNMAEDQPVSEKVRLSEISG